MNKDNYKKAIDQIHAKEELKEKTFEKIKQENVKTKNRIIPIRRFLAACAVVMIVFSMTAIYLDNNNQPEHKVKQINEEINIAKVKNDLPRFESIEQLREVLEENYRNDYLLEDITITGATASKAETEIAAENSTVSYSRTNTQVENVDEADIVKTDGMYIYYVTNNKVYIINAAGLNIVSEIEIEQNDEKFYPQELYVNEDKLILLGNTSATQTVKSRVYSTEEAVQDSVRVKSRNMANAIVVDISNKEKPKEIRRVGIDGNYKDSRMIDNNIYIISSKYIYYYDDMEDDEILPILRDSASSQEEKTVECTDIAYFKGTENYSYMIVAGFNINDKEEANFETFFGASDTIYSSEKNLYIAKTTYGAKSNNTTTLYKFNLDESQILLQCKGEVKGDLNNQFSMDEYNGNLRIATTDGWDDDSENQLYILDENLKEIGKIENLAKGEKIYSVRFVGKIGYIVTFKQIDPLFVVDLSDPTSPEVKGELKIPGYSSYLHPYDENHIIGIGYNTKTTLSGGVTNKNMKMSMFDVSDLENPKEMFGIDIGESYTYSESIIL